MTRAELYEQTLRERHGDIGYLAKGLEDYHARRLTNSSLPAFMGAGLDHEEEGVLISGLIEDTYKSMVDYVKNISIQIMIERVKKIPNVLDTFIDKLREVLEASGARLASAMRWVSRNLTDFFNYLMQLFLNSSIGQAFTRLWNTISTNWFAIKVSNVLKSTIQSIAEVYLGVFEALRTQIYAGIEFIHNISACLMDSLMDAHFGSDKSREEIVETLFLYMTLGNDISRYAADHPSLLKTRLYNLRLELADIHKKSIRVIKENTEQQEGGVALLQEAVTQNDFFQKTLSSVVSGITNVVTWIFEHFLWLYHTLRRLVSTAQMLFGALMAYSILFGRHLGQFIKDIMDSHFNDTQLIPGAFQRSMESAGILLEKADLKPETRRNLVNAVELAQNAFNQTFALGSLYYIRSLDGLSAKQQSLMCRESAAALTEIWKTQNDELAYIDTERVQRIYKATHGGADPFESYLLFEAAMQTLDANYAVALGEFLNVEPGVDESVDEQAAPIGQSPDDDDDDDDEGESETFRLQKRFANVQNQIKRVQKDMEDFEIGKSWNMSRGVSYLRTAEKFAEEIKTRNLTAPTQDQIEALQLVCAHAVTLTNEGKLRVEFANLMTELALLYHERNRLRKRLNMVLKPVQSRKYKFRVAAIIFVSACTIAFFAALAYFAPAGNIFTPGTTAFDEVAFETAKKTAGWYNIYYSSQYFAKAVDWAASYGPQWIASKFIGTATVNFVHAINPTTYVNFLSHFNDIRSVFTVVNFPLVTLYLGVNLAFLPSVAAVAIYIFNAIFMFGAWVIDYHSDVGVPKIILEGREPSKEELAIMTPLQKRDLQLSRERLTYTSQRAYYYWSQVQGGAGPTFIYVFNRISTAYLGVLTAQIDASMSVLSIAAAFVTWQNPFGKIVDQLSGMIPDAGKMQTFLERYNLTPNAMVMEKIRPLPSGMTYTPIEGLGSFRTLLLDLPYNSPLLTGGLAAERLLELQNTQRPYLEISYRPTRALTPGGPTVEEVTDDDEEEDEDELRRQMGIPALPWKEE